jgi:hypothetical protein
MAYLMGNYGTGGDFLLVAPEWWWRDARQDATGEVDWGGRNAGWGAVGDDRSG